MSEEDAGGLGLHWKILIGIVLGIAVGAALQQSAVAPLWRFGDLFLGRDSYVQPIAALGDGVGKLFLDLLKMLVVPLIFASLVTGVVSVPLSGLRSMSGWTFGYYLTTSVLAIGTGLILVNAIGPGRGLSYDELVAASGGDSGDVAAATETVESKGLGVITEVIDRMVPENIVDAASSNSTILSVIFFALLLGLFIKKSGGEHAQVLSRFFAALFEVMMRMTSWVISLAPYGIFGAMIGFAAKGGLAVAGDLALYMATVALALLVHATVTMPVILWLVARRSPYAYARALSPALLTAFSTASSNATLPLTMRCVEERAGVDPKVSSFTLPLGATINMDGTALYEAVAVLFIAQTLGDLSLGQQVAVAFTALAASIGAAGIPHAGLVMMVIVLQAVNLPTDAVIVILAVDRLLDMGRTTVNVWSDSCAAAVVAARTAKGAEIPSESSGA